MLDRRDISAGATPNDRFEGAHTGTGNVAYNWSQDGEFSDTGLFALVDASIGERLSVILGTRLDSYDVTTYGTDVNGVFGSAEDQDDASSYNASTNFELTQKLNLYATYATSEFLELGQGGMVVEGDRRTEYLAPGLRAVRVRPEGLPLLQRIYFNLLHFTSRRNRLQHALARPSTATSRRASSSRPALAATERLELHGGGHASGYHRWKTHRSS